MPWYEQHIITDPTICGGQPVIRGTQIPIHGIVRQLLAATPLEDIAANYTNVTERDLRAVVAYAAARMLKRDPGRKPRVFGAAKDLVEISESFDDPLPDDLLKAFGAEP